MKIEDLFTREASNVGTKMFVVLPDGTKTEEWLQVHYEDSDEFRRARDRGMHDLALMMHEKDEELRLAIGARNRVQLTAAMVSGWSFETPFNKENLEKLLTEAPSLRDQIDKFCSNRRNFFKKSETSSANSGEQSSDS